MTETLIAAASPTSHAFQPMTIHRAFPFLTVCLLAAGCVQVEVKPIHIIVDVNVKTDKALDDFFGDIDKKSATIQLPPTPSSP